MRKLLVLCFIFFSFYSERSLAAFLFEPYLGVQKGQFLENQNKGDMQSVIQGMRTGYSGNYFMLGLDLGFANAKFDSPFLSETNQERYNNVEVAFFMGLLFNRMKLYASYGASYIRKRYQNPTKRTYYGDTAKIGLGIRPFWKFFINIEKIHTVYDEYEEDRTLTFKVPTFKSESWAATISLVFRL